MRYDRSSANFCQQIIFCPVQRKYIENRPGQFHYHEAIKRDLPIGSGKIESTHRSLMQKRLKKPGTWWLRENAEKIADLRTLRENGGWELLWQQNSKMNPIQVVA